MCNWLAVSMALWLSIPSHAQLVEVKETPVSSPTGREKAQNYFKGRKASKSRGPASEEGSSSSGGNDSLDTPRLMSLHVGTFFTDEAYSWGHGDAKNIGRFNAGVDYRLGEWVNAADLSMRIDYTSYSLDEGAARKLSLGAIVTFPDAKSRFPLYFGAGLGPGFFIKQIRNSSAMSLDYSLFAGVRFLNVLDHVGFLIETGLKDHVHLFSEGQFNGVYVNVGSVFAF